MKRKTIVLLSSVMAGALLVGGAFAAFAVTDNAEEKGIITTPGTLSTLTTVTLNWGEGTSVDNLEGLQLGTQTLAGKVNLVATLSKGNSYTGSFDIHYEDRTNGEERLAKFIDYLNVKVYSGELTQPDPDKYVGGLLVGDEDFKVSLPLAGSATGEVFSIFVELDATAAPVLEDIKGDEVYIGFDWNKNPTDQTATNFKVYYEGAYNYAYYWNDTQSIDWPGLPMANEGQGRYSVEVPLGMTKIIFNDGNSGEGHQTSDIELSGWTEAKPLYKDGVWYALDDEPTEIQYFLVGILNGAQCWSVDDGIALVANTQSEGEFMLEQPVHLLVDDAIKVASENNDWYPEGMGTEYVITEAGDYQIYFRPDGQGDQQYWHYGYFYVEKLPQL